jgi:hypothetical protein
MKPMKHFTFTQANKILIVLCMASFLVPSHLATLGMVFIFASPNTNVIMGSVVGIYASWKRGK